VSTTPGRLSDSNRRPESSDAAGLREIEATALPVRLEHPTFDAWWEPFTRSVGPAGVYLAILDADRRTKLREDCRRQVPSEPFLITAVAWAARGQS